MSEGRMAVKKYKSGMGYTTYTDDKKIVVEIPITNLVKAFYLCPSNDVGSRVKPKQKGEFAEWVAKMIVSEECQHDGASFADGMFDEIFQTIFEGYSDVDFVNLGKEE